MPLIEAHVPRSLQVVTQVQDLRNIYFDLRLPPGFFVHFTPDLLYLYRKDRTLVEKFDSHGLELQEITRAAWEDVQQGKEV